VAIPLRDKLQLQEPRLQKKKQKTKIKTKIFDHVFGLEIDLDKKNTLPVDPTNSQNVNTILGIKYELNKSS